MTLWSLGGGTSVHFFHHFHTSYNTKAMSIIMALQAQNKQQSFTVREWSLMINWGLSAEIAFYIIKNENMQVQGFTLKW